MSFIRRHPARTLATFSFATIAGTSYFYYTHREKLAQANQTFAIATWDRDSAGKRVQKRITLPLMVPEEMERRLRLMTTRGSAFRDGIQWNWHTAQLPANNPVEDAFSSMIVERDPPPSSVEQPLEPPTRNGDLIFFSVFDGHGGPYTSLLLSKTLIPTVGLELSSIMNQTAPSTPPTWSIPTYLHSWLRLTPTSSLPNSKTFDQDPKYVSLAIQTAFAKLDSEIINAPLRLMTEHLERKQKDPNVQDLHEDTLAKSAVQAALTGSCALLALLDTGARNLYVACTGDSRAVAGYFDENKGSWTVDVLTEDQTGRNPNELKRIQSEHPPEEQDHVVMRGRILGGLEPSRAFGDARYKWSRDLQEKIARFFFSETALPRGPPSKLLTPPYVTPRPEVTYRVEFLPSSDKKPPSSKMRFLILATDGLWDTISSQDACALVAGYLVGLRGTIPKKELHDRLKLSTSTEGIDGKRPREKGGNEAGTWEFKDDNVATHLLRNALGGGNDEQLRQLMSISAPLARSYRDDTTITVVWWDEGKEGEKQQVKAKL